MGARAQVKIEDTGVYLYTHWGSEELPKLLQTILSSTPAQARQNDPEYLARIIFDGMIGDEQGTETGYGIGTSAHIDLDYSPIIINCQEGYIVSPNGKQTIAEFLQTDL